MEGAPVLAVASGRHPDFLHDLGTGQFMDCAKMVPETVLRAVDLAVDAVGGASTGHFLPAYKPAGALLPIIF